MDNPSHKHLRIAELILLQLKGELTGPEKTELDEWINQSAANLELYDQLTDPETLQTEVSSFYRSKKNIEAKIKEVIAAPKVIPLWKKWVAAASIILAISLGGYLVLNRPAKKDDVVKMEPSKDVKAPETNRAVIILANGQKVYLDSAANGTLAQQGNIKLVKLANGHIAYQTASGEIIKELQYNTLSNPRGSKVIDMQLSDGSHVWLNAGSSVTYPIAFIGNERKVSITGEAYFEIAHNSAMPFKVSKDKTEVTVLGTHFNVNAYEDEAEIKVTLLEGSVEVKNKNEKIKIQPGQQARVDGSAVKVVSNVNLEQVMAWKNGRFQFDGAGIEDVMRQIARWYDVEVVYEVKPREVHFGGGISRDVEASKVFKMLETTEAVHFRIEGKKVYVIR